MLASNRAEFAKVCLSFLGYPVTQVNVANTQIDNCIDLALQWWHNYSADGTTRQYVKHLVQANDFPDVVKTLVINNGGTLYANTDTVVFTGSCSTPATATVTTNANGVITALTITEIGKGYNAPPVVTIQTSTGNGADITAEQGGYITLPDNIIGMVEFFDLQNAVTSISNMFSIQYQIALNEIWSLSSYSMIPYYQTIQHLNLIQQLLVGRQPIRYNRKDNRAYLDMSWERVAVGDYLIADCYAVCDPASFPKVWSDPWLIEYTSAQIKRVYGTNLKKFGQMQLPGGIIFNGKEIYQEADEDCKRLEEQIKNEYALPAAMFLG